MLEVTAFGRNERRIPLNRCRSDPRTRGNHRVSDRSAIGNDVGPMEAGALIGEQRCEQLHVLVIARRASAPV